MQVLATKWFAKFARRERITDQQLCSAVENAESGLISADLGDGLIKQRIARLGQRKSSGFRALIAYRTGERAVFVYGFAKNERDNIENTELADWRLQAADWLAADDDVLALEIAQDGLKEIDCG